MAHKRKGKKKPSEKVDVYKPLFIQDINYDSFKPVIGAKNLWLYPEDGIGRLEQGVVRKSDTNITDDNSKLVYHVLELE